MDYIKIVGAREGNLKNISLNIPKNKLVVFTGLSGSGKSTLLVDVLYNECQRQYLEAMAFQGIQKPEVDSIKGASPAIVISQTEGNRNPRSTVGTLTDIYTDMRMIYEKLGTRHCPFCGEVISAADCREETRKDGDDFYVYMYCNKCGKRMDKITRTWFSFNTKEGACPTCQGLGKIHTIQKQKTVDETLSLKEGAVRCWEGQYGKYQISILKKAFQHYDLPFSEDIPVEKFSDVQKEILYEGTDSEKVKQYFPDKNPPKTTTAGRFEGVFPILRRRLAEKSGETGILDEFFDVIQCPECKGERLCKTSREVPVNHVRLPELFRYSLSGLSQWIEELSGLLPERSRELTAPYLLDIKTKLNRFLKVGLGYLTIDRQMITLSGGELQRLKLAAALDSELSGIIYILDEPTAGLHPRDTRGLVEILKRLRDFGNTVLVIEHDEDVMREADYIMDMGPGSGRLGGEIVAEGTLAELKMQKKSVTGSYFSAVHEGKKNFRKASGYLQIENAVKFNLKGISVQIPTGCFVSVTGPSGSGKSTLLFEILAKGKNDAVENRVSGLEQFDEIVCVEQMGIPRMRRSNVATSSGVYTEIRNVFAKEEAAKKAGLGAKYFSFNTVGGRCDNCEGLGFVDNNMLFFANTKTICPVCRGKRFKPEILAVKHKGLSIKEVLDLSVHEAMEIFEEPKIFRILKILSDVGLGYLQLGQTLDTLSGGEGQRLKLAGELTGKRSGKKTLYLMDEPTVGLHPKDVEHFLLLLNAFVDEGNTVIVAEHNRQLIQNSDWIIDLGPEGGDQGGYLQFEGTPDCFYSESFAQTVDH